MSCFYCKGPVENRIVCTGCGDVEYCSKQCRVDDAPHHEHTCELMGLVASVGKGNPGAIVVIAKMAHWALGDKEARDTVRRLLEKCRRDGLVGEAFTRLHGETAGQPIEAFMLKIATSVT